MQRIRLYLPVKLLLVSLAIALVAQAKPKKDKVDLPKIFDSARYVYIEPYEGDRNLPYLLAEDRLAILSVQKQLNDWGRYSITTSRAQADFVLVVHRGRRANGDDGSFPPSSSGPAIYGPQRPQNRSPFPPGATDPASTSDGSGRGGDDEIATPEDQLSAYIPNGSDDSLTTRIWTHSQRNGLSGQQPPLFKRLKDDVEAAYPK